MDIRQLKTLIAIHYHGSFAKAGEYVGLTPSAVTQQMNSLEQEFQEILFDRMTRPPRLNDKGLILLDMAQNFVQQFDETRDRIKFKKLAGSLTMGATSSINTGFLPLAIKRIKEENPDLVVKLKVGISHSLPAEVESGNLDIAFVAPNHHITNNVIYRCFLKEPLYLIAPLDTKNATISDILNQMPYIRFRKNAVLSELIDAELLRYKVKINEIAELDTMSAIVQWASSGLGISIVPHFIIHFPIVANVFKKPLGIFREMGIIERTDSKKKHIIRQLHNEMARLGSEFGITRYE